MASGVGSVSKAYISAGSNQGNREQNLKFAVTTLAGEITVTQVSSCFETEPVGYRNQPWFLNIVIEVATSHTPQELLEICQRIEQLCGRARTFRNAPRTLDLDILLFDDTVIHEETLIIPHPRLQERRFVLEPLVQIAPSLTHPVLKKTILSLLEACPDRSEVRQLT